MDLLRSLAYDYYLGPFPLVVLVGFATYALLFAAALLVSLKRWIPWMRRVPVRVHRRLAIAAIVMATIHLLLGLSVYI
jgi:hypothetical protein